MNRFDGPIRGWRRWEWTQFGLMTGGIVWVLMITLYELGLL